MQGPKRPCTTFFTDRMTMGEKRYYCQAVTRKQFEAASWADAHIGCSRIATTHDKDGWFCRQHEDPNKRYGVNRLVEVER